MTKKNIIPTKLTIAFVLFFILVACTKNPQDIQKKAVKCLSSGDYECAESNYRWLVTQKPDDVRFQANLAFALTSQGKHAEAITLYQKLINEGEGAYDLFAYYARSLDAVGRDDDAITWNYRTLSIVPELVDVRGELAKLLIKRGRPYEALSLLTSFDSQLEIKGKHPYFAAKRIAITSTLPAPQENTTITHKTVKIGGHHYSVVIGEHGESLSFLIDTGASHTTMSPQALKIFSAAIPSDAKRIILQTADNRKIIGQEFILPTLQVGPYSLKNIKVVVCETCEPLLGQSTLERFDLATSNVGGVDYLTLKLRQQIHN